MGFRDSLPSDSAGPIRGGVHQGLLAPSYAPLVLDSMRRGEGVFTWVPITSTAKGKSGATHTATFFVTSDALQLDGIRFNVSAIIEQQIADMLGAVLLTAKLGDLIWFQRQVTLAPVILSQTPASLNYLSTIEYMLRHSDGVNALLAKLPEDQRAPELLRCDVGKDWIVADSWHDQPQAAVNYGYWSPSAPYACATSEPGKPCRVYQPPPPGSRAHPPTHLDASQIARFASRACLVDGRPDDTQRVYQDPELAPLASSEGALRVVRQPGAPPATARSAPEVTLPTQTASLDDCPDAALGHLVKTVPWSGAVSSFLAMWGGAWSALPLGTIVRDVVDGMPVLGRVECRQAFGGGAYRNGIVLYRPGQPNARGELQALMSPPAGWPGS
jgi:hypothetical protein